MFPRFALLGHDQSGSTAVCVFISPRLIYVANCGDSRVILSRAGSPIFSTKDHKPALPMEKDRIVKAGGYVMMQRINGNLAVSRALGDFDYKKMTERGPCEQMVSPEPDIFVRDREETQDEFLVLACDGVWDVMESTELCQYIRSRLLVTDDLQKIASDVIDTCLYKVREYFMSIYGQYFVNLRSPLSGKPR